jgi:pimeloyl-ACP methyl ester carboxylesterase
MHGNAQNMSTHWAFAEWLLARGYNLFEFDYRSYGKSDNVQPEPKGVFEDAVAALDYVRSRQDIDTDKLFVFGQSLGGMLAIAATAASPKGVRALVAEAPFYNYSELADDRRLGDGEWMDNTYTAGAYIKQLSVPLLLIHGTHDSIVHLSHSERILAEAPGPKRLETIKYGRHTDAMTDRHGGGYQDIVARFLETQKP